jgi:quinol monooxygenase YgiN
MSLPTDENRELLTVVATIRAKAGKEQEARELLESLVAPTRAEDGNHAYALHQGVKDPTEFIFFETWESQAHLDAHLGSAHMKAARPQMGELLEPGTGIALLNRVA